MIEVTPALLDKLAERGTTLEKECAELEQHANRLRGEIAELTGQPPNAIA